MNTNTYGSLPHDSYDDRLVFVDPPYTMLKVASITNPKFTYHIMLSE